jgi:tryptophan-rich sensory protein
MGDRFYKQMLFGAAVWNVLGGAFIIARSEWIFGREGLSLPVPPLYYFAWIALFMTFGIGYYIVYRDPFANTNIIVLGIIGKLAFSAVFLWNMMAYPGQVPRLFIIPVVGDLVFVVFFIMFLRYAHSRTNPGAGRP